MLLKKAALRAYVENRYYYGVIIRGRFYGSWLLQMHIKKFGLIHLKCKVEVCDNARNYISILTTKLSRLSKIS